MTLQYVKKLPNLAKHYKTTPDLKPTPPKGLLPDLPDPTRGISTSLTFNKEAEQDNRPWAVSEFSICFLTNFLSDRAVWNQVYFPKLCLCQTNIVYWCHRVLWVNHSRHGFNYPGSLANESPNVRIEDVLCLEQTHDSNYNGKPKHCVCIFSNYLYNIIFMSVMEI